MAGDQNSGFLTGAALDRVGAVAMPGNCLREPAARSRRPAFSFTPPPDARQVDVADLAKLKDMSELPSNFRIGGK